MRQNKFVFLSKKRWARLKIFTFLIFLSLSVAVYLGFAGFTQSPFVEMSATNSIKEIVDKVSTKNPGQINVEGQGSVLKLSQSEGNYKLKRENLAEPAKKLVVLTFDDGPNPQYTEPILDILKRGNIKASFFVVGENAYKFPETLKRIVDDGHLLGVHTFTHSSDEKINYYDKPERMFYEFELTQRVIEQNTQTTSKAFRIPYWGTEETITLNNLVLAANAQARGYQIIGSTVDSSDWEAKSASSILDQIKLQPENIAVVLLHDGGGNRQYTVQALPGIINHYRELGYSFGTIEDLVPGESLMVPSTEKDLILASTTFTFFDFYRKTPIFLTQLFLLGLGIYILHTTFVVVFALVHKLREKEVGKRKLKHTPFISVVVPIFNEEKVIKATLMSIIQSKYQNYEIIIINDGSTDKSSEIVESFIVKYRQKKIWLFEQINTGKFSALNHGFAQARGQIVVGIDADTRVNAEALEAFARHFTDKKIGAVAGRVKVGNQINFLTKLQELDYMMALNLERRAFSFLDSVFVVPGAIGAWRTDAVLEAGGFSGETLTEDGELGMRLKKLGYRIDFESKAIGFTEAPEKFSPLLRQRFRWTFGSLQTMWLHKDMLFRPKYGVFGLLVFPYTFFIQLPSLFLAPFFEFFAIPLAIFVSYKLVLLMFSAMLLGRLILFFVACFIGGESIRLAAYVLPYRFFYQFVWYFVFDLAIWVALKGSFIAWNKMERTGTIAVSEQVEPLITYSEIRKV